MKPREVSLTGLLQPHSMEPKTVFVNRFHANREMRLLFGDSRQRVDAANAVFAAKWAEACVTVRKLDGEEFFIE